MQAQKPIFATLGFSVRFVNSPLFYKDVSALFIGPFVEKQPAFQIGVNQRRRRETANLTHASALECTAGTDPFFRQCRMVPAQDGQMR